MSEWIPVSEKLPEAKYEYHFEPVEDKPGYVWFSKRNFQIISIENLQKLLKDGQINEVNADDETNN